MTDKPKIQLTEAQLRAIAALKPGEHLYRLEGALEPIGRAHLVRLWNDARARTIDAHGPVRDERLGGAGWETRASHLPHRPINEAALQAALQALAQAEADEAAAWARIQRLVDRAKELLAQQSSSSTA